MRREGGHRGGREGRSGGAPPQGRRAPPPERTGIEAAYLGALEEAKREVVVCLRGGQTLCGTIEGFDREVIVLARGEGRAEVVRKSEIRYVEESGSAGSGGG